MGVNKAFLEIEGQPLVEKTVSFLRDIFREVIIVTNDPLLFVHLPVTITTDIHKNAGSLGGLYTGLFHSPCEHAFVFPCDMPFLHRPFIEYMATRRHEGLVLVPKPPDGLQPLHAIYSRQVLKPMYQFLAAGKCKIIDLYPSLKTVTIPEEVILTYDREGKMFFNINSPADLARYLAVAHPGLAYANLPQEGEK
jgi:molybdopterin-guanine dinucleotide biosynthesis protein A